MGWKWKESFSWWVLPIYSCWSHRGKFFLKCQVQGSKEQTTWKRKKEINRTPTMKVPVSTGHSQLGHWMQAWSLLLKKGTAQVEKKGNKDAAAGDVTLEKKNQDKTWDEMHRMMRSEQSGEGSTGLHSTLLKLQNSLHTKNINGFKEENCIGAGNHNECSAFDSGST